MSDTVMAHGVAGVSSMDAYVAACIGSAILRVDRAATDGDTLVDYTTDPHPHGALATCNATSDGRVALYRVYVPSLWAKVKEVGAPAAGIVIPVPAVVAGIAAHEVRHRLQKRLRGSLRLFAIRYRPRPDPDIRYVAAMCRRVLAVQRRRLRMDGADPAYIRLATGATEYDAFLIENLVVQRLGERAAADEIAALVNLNDAP